MAARASGRSNAWLHPRQFIRDLVLRRLPSAVVRPTTRGPWAPVYLVTDNDGVDGWSGETQYPHLGRLHDLFGTSG